MCYLAFIKPSQAGAQLAATENETAGGAGAEPETEGACGWSKSQMSLELVCGGQTDVRKHLYLIYNTLILTCFGFSQLSTCLSVCLSILRLCTWWTLCPGVLTLMR